MNCVTRLLPALSLFALAAASAGAPTGHAANVDVSAAEHVQPALPVIPDRTFKLTDFGAVGDGQTLNTEAFQKAIAAVEAAGGGHLEVPAGRFRTLPFALCSNLDLHLDEGAFVLAPDSFAAYGMPDPSTLKSQDEVRAKVMTPAPLITGHSLHDVSLTGPGTIDGNGAMWWAWSERAARRQPGRIVLRRPMLVVINGCQRLLVSDITLTNSPMFHLVPRDITDLTIERVKVIAPFNAPNTDAIDPGPVTNALIRDCDIDTGDDDIVIKSGGTNILIENNTIKHGHGISIGSGTTVGIHNMLVRHCTFDGADNGIRIKSMRGAGGPVENVRYTDIQMTNVENPILLDLNYTDSNRPNFTGDPTKIPSIKNVLIDHVTATASTNALKIVGLPESRITDVTLQDVTITAAKGVTMNDADNIDFDHVTISVEPGVAPPRPSEN